MIGSNENAWQLIRESSADPLVAYLRDAEFRWLRKDRSRPIGSALDYRLQLEAALMERMNRMTPELKDEIHLMEIRRHLVNKGKDDLAKTIKSLEDCDQIPREFLRTFTKERWYFNQTVNHDSTDEYQLLCLGHPSLNRLDQPIRGINDLNNVGNSLQADLQYMEFSDMVFKELRGDDTEEQGVKKALAIRDKYFPNMKDRVIPWLLADLAEAIDDLHSYWKMINFYWKLWFRVEKKREPISDVVSDLIGATRVKCILTEFAQIKEYIAQRRRNGSRMRDEGLIISYMENIAGCGEEPKRIIGGDYLLYVKEKIRMALHLGIIQKEDVIKSGAGSELLKDIEQYNPRIFIGYKPSKYY